MSKEIAYYHLPGLFEFYDFYQEFLKLYRTKREYFYEWCEIGSIYGAPADALWGGGRVGFGDAAVSDVLALLDEYGISGRLTFSNSLLTKEHLADVRCNRLCKSFADRGGTHGVIVYSDLLLAYLREIYPNLYLVSSTTKVLTSMEECLRELEREEFAYVVPDFRLNKELSVWQELPTKLLDKVEVLCNECCSFTCKDRAACYEAVSRKALGIAAPEHICRAEHAGEGYRFSRAMQNPAFIGINDIRSTYLHMGISNFKIEGRGLGSAMLLEFLLYYMTKPEAQLIVREALYLDAMLDLF